MPLSWSSSSSEQIWSRTFRSSTRIRLLGTENSPARLCFFSIQLQWQNTIGHSDGQAGATVGFPKSTCSFYRLMFQSGALICLFNGDLYDHGCCQCSVQFIWEYNTCQSFLSIFQINSNPKLTSFECEKLLWPYGYTALPGPDERDFTRLIECKKVLSPQK